MICSGRSGHSGPAGRYPSNTTTAAPASAPRRPAPKAFEVAKGFAGLEVYDGKTRSRLDKYDIPVEVSGEGAPAPADGFEEAGLAEAVLRNVARCGYDSPTPLQGYSIPIVLSRRDLMACAQTGSGKTAAFCLPMVSGLVAAAASAGGRGGAGGRGEREAYGYDDYSRAARPRALVLAPTRELAAQIHEEAKKFSHQTGIKVKVADGGPSMIHQLRDIEGGVDILVATPGRLVDIIEISTVSLEAIKYLVMDEADRMLDMGFEPEIRKIVDDMGMPRKSVRQTMLFSATFPPQIQRLASDFLSKYIFITVGRVGSSTDLITQKLEFVTNDEKKNYLLDLLQEQSFCSTDGKLQQPLTLVFVETKREADSLRYWLYNRGFPATVIHGDRTEEERKSALRSWKSVFTPIMVGTDADAWGLDVPNVSHVINYDLPKSIEDYIHRIGRTGRAGNAGRATAFFTEQNHPIAKGLLELMTDAKQNVPLWLKDYARRPYDGGQRICFGDLENGLFFKDSYAGIIKGAIGSRKRKRRAPVHLNTSYSLKVPCSFFHTRLQPLQIEDMRITVLLGQRSSFDAKKWQCPQCDWVNKPERHLIAHLPQFYCKRCEYDLINMEDYEFSFSMSDITVNGHCPIGNIKDQGEKDECGLYATGLCLEINDRMQTLLRGEKPNGVYHDGPVVNIGDLRAKTFRVMENKANLLTVMSTYETSVKAFEVACTQGVKQLKREQPNNAPVKAFGKQFGVCEFQSMIKAIADGNAQVGFFPTGKKFQDLRFGQIYKAPQIPLGNHNKKIEGHAAVFLGGGKKRKEYFLHFANSHNVTYCQRIPVAQAPTRTPWFGGVYNGKPKKFPGGFGKIRATDAMVLPPLQFARSPYSSS